MTAKELSEDNFEEETGKGSWVVDFWAPWCGPCKKMKPVFKEASEKIDSHNFGKVDISENQGLANKHSIRSIPTLVKIEDGEIKDQKMGVMSLEEIKEWLEQ